MHPRSWGFWRRGLEDLTRLFNNLSVRRRATSQWEPSTWTPSWNCNQCQHDKWYIVHSSMHSFVNLCISLFWKLFWKSCSFSKKYSNEDNPANLSFWSKCFQVFSNGALVWRCMISGNNLNYKRNIARHGDVQYILQGNPQLKSTLPLSHELHLVK